MACASSVFSGLSVLCSCQNGCESHPDTVCALRQYLPQTAARVLPAFSAAIMMRYAVGIVSTHKFHIVALHALKAHPDVSMDVFHDVGRCEKYRWRRAGQW